MLRPLSRDLIGEAVFDPIDEGTSKVTGCVWHGATSFRRDEPAIDEGGRVRTGRAAVSL
jgi:hypothetical protein